MHSCAVQVETAATLADALLPSGEKEQLCLGAKSEDQPFFEQEMCMCSGQA